MDGLRPPVLRKCRLTRSRKWSTFVKQSKSWAATRNGKEAFLDAQTFPVCEMVKAAAAFLISKSGSESESWWP